MQPAPPGGPPWLCRGGEVREQAPEWLERYCPAPVADAGAYRRIRFEQGDACRLAFPDDSFDVVITRQALEQMNKIRDEALSEIARVARHHVVLGEPFADFNREGLRLDYVKAKEYLDLPVAELARFGLYGVGSNRPGVLLQALADGLLDD